MKLNVYQTIKILFFLVLLSETIICFKTETSTEGRFLMRSRFLKANNKKRAPTSVPGTVRRNPAPRLEALNLIQKSETAKNILGQDMGATDSLAKKLASQRPPNPNDPAPLDLNIGTGPVWVTGWIKYFKYYPSAKTLNLTPEKTPRQFMINPEYDEQFKLYPKFNKKEKSKDDFGNDLNVYITDKNRFYARLVKDQILILSARQVNN